MDNNRFIDLKTFEVMDDIPNYIIVDKDISRTIAILNKKGYKTKASCSGHYHRPEMWLQENIDIDFLGEVKKDSMYVIKDIREKEFDCWSEIRVTSVYVMFDKKYVFSKLPEDFIQESDSTIRCTINFFDNNDTRKSKEIILNEIEKYNKILEDWANNLPNIN